MAWPTVTDKRHGRLGCPLLLACLLGLALLLGHQLVMASPWHAAAMSMDRGRVMPAAVTTRVVAVPADDLIPHTTPRDQQPLTRWQECLSQDGLLPALLLLLALAGIWWRLTSAALADMYSRVEEQVARFLRPPPLAPSRRRALLQVFRN